MSRAVTSNSRMRSRIDAIFEEVAATLPPNSGAAIIGNRSTKPGLPQMALPLEQVVKQLNDSGIIAPGKLENFIPPKADPKTVDELVQALVKSENLTAFQGQQVKAGKAKSLILGEYTILDKIGAGGTGCRGLQGSASPDEAARGDQDVAARGHEGCGGRGSLPARGRSCRQVAPPEHRRRGRCR